MNILYQALTGSYTNQGIKNLNIYYDTLFTNIKTYNPPFSAYNEYMLIDKLVFDYDANIISSDNSNIISFGDTENGDPSITTGNGLIGNILLDDVKKVLICGLSSYGITPLTATVNNIIIQGNSYTPVVYEYNINNTTLHQIYPLEDDWSKLVLGTYQLGQTPAVSYNKNTHELNMLFKTTLSANNSTSINVINDVSFIYNNTLKLAHVNQLTSLSSNNNFSDFKIFGSALFDSGEKIILTNKNNSIQLFELG